MEKSESPSVGGQDCYGGGTLLYMEGKYEEWEELAPLIPHLCPCLTSVLSFLFCCASGEFKQYCVIPLSYGLFIEKALLEHLRPLCSPAALDTHPVGTEPGDRSTTCQLLCCQNCPFPPSDLASVLHCALCFWLLLPLADFSPRILPTLPRNWLLVGLLHRFVQYLPICINPAANLLYAWTGFKN